MAGENRMSGCTEEARRLDGDAVRVEFLSSRRRPVGWPPGAGAGLV